MPGWSVQRYCTGPGVDGAVNVCDAPDSRPRTGSAPSRIVWVCELGLVNVTVPPAVIWALTGFHTWTKGTTGFPVGVETAVTVALLCACASVTMGPATAPAAMRATMQIRCFMERRYASIARKAKFPV